LALEENLNLMTKRELRSITGSIAGWRFDLADARLFGWKSNVILFGRRLDGNDEGASQPRRVPTGTYE
jgi:hypothetical protein